MSTIKYALLLVALFAPVFASAAPYASVDIYMDGDSTQYGYMVTGGTLTCNDGASTTGCTINSYGHNNAGGVAVQQVHNEPAVVQQDMINAFGPVVTAENHGVGGMTVLDSINGTNRYDCATNGNNESSTCGPLGQRVAASHALVFTFHFLTNDQYRMTPAAFGAYISTWISTVQGNKNADGIYPIAVIEESAPICRNDAPNVGPFLDALRTAANNANVLLVLQHDWVYANYNWIPALPDCVHPDDDLYLTMGHRESTAMGRTVQVLLGR